jgi:PAS domain S-box-containing protein
LRPDSTIPREHALQRDLIDAAIAVNEAPTLDEAFRVLADAGLRLLDCDRVTVVVWRDDLASGTLHADTAGVLDGKSVLAMPGSAEAIREEAAYAGTPRLEGFEPHLAASLHDMNYVVRVPISTESGTSTFHALWQRTLTDDEAEEASALLRTLTRLTSIAERSLGERERIKLDNVLENVVDGVVVVSRTGETSNAAARAILGVPDGVEFASSLFNLRTLDGAPVQVAAERLPEGERTAAVGDDGRVRVRATALDGRDLVLDASVAWTAAGTVVVFRDVTEEHQRAVLNERYLVRLFDSVPVPLAVVDATSHELISANQAYLDAIGFQEDEVVGATPPFPWWDRNEDAASGFDPTSVIRRLYRRKDGSLFPVEVTSHLIPGDDGRTAFLLGVVTDLSEKRRLDQQLVQSGKLAAIGELAAGVAHEINNPLFAILGLTEFLLKEAEPGSKPHQRLELIQQTGLEIKEIVRALLDFARENAEDRLVVPLDDVVRSTVDLVRRTNSHKGVELSDSYSGDGALVNASPNQLKQIFLNLIANARQAMPNGGNVSVDVRRDGDHVLAVVTDDGPGIESPVLERIFEPFFTTKRSTGGTGLGLSVSLGIAESHGGTLTASSEPGHGTAFTLRLPIAEETA